MLTGPAESQKGEPRDFRVVAGGGEALQRQAPVSQLLRTVRSTIILGLHTRKARGWRSESVVPHPVPLVLHV